jgi:hypothetical protein
MNPLDNVTIVIRSVGERTETLCKQLILQQGVPEDHVFTIHEQPFSRAMKVGYQLGVDQNRTWTYCVDADVLLRDGAVHDMIAQISKMPANTLGISGELLDKLLGKRRTVGNHLFQTKFLSRMIENILPYEKEDIRPESSIIKKLMSTGLTFKKNVDLIGLHDFEQHYHDIARKAFTHSRKHIQHMDEFVSYWLTASQNDMDFKAALFGLSKGIIQDDEVKINVDIFGDLYSEVDLRFEKKNEDVMSFEIKSGKDVVNVINDPDNYFYSGKILDDKFEKIFKKKFKNKKYKTLIRHFLGKVLADLGLLSTKG